MVFGGGYVFLVMDGCIFISLDEIGVFNVYMVDLVIGECEQLMMFEINVIFVLSWFLEDDCILVMVDGGGDEFSYIYFCEEDGCLVDFIFGENFCVMFLGWFLDGMDMWVVINQCDVVFFDIYEIDMVVFEVGVVFQNDDSLQIGLVSLDGCWFFLVCNCIFVDSDILLLDLLVFGVILQLIIEYEGNIVYGDYIFILESDVLVYVINEYGEFNQVWIYDLVMGDIVLLIEVDWDVFFVSYLLLGCYCVYGINVDVFIEVMILDCEIGEVLFLFDFLVGELCSVCFFCDEGQIVFLINFFILLFNLYMVDLVEQM